MGQGRQNAVELLHELDDAVGIDLAWLQAIDGVHKLMNDSERNGRVQIIGKRGSELRLCCIDGVLNGPIRLTIWSSFHFMSDEVVQFTAEFLGLIHQLQIEWKRRHDSVA